MSLHTICLILRYNVLSLFQPGGFIYNAFPSIFNRQRIVHQYPPRPIITYGYPDFDMSLFETTDWKEIMNEIDKEIEEGYELVCEDEDDDCNQSKKDDDDKNAVWEDLSEILITKQTKHKTKVDDDCSKRSACVVWSESNHSKQAKPSKKSLTTCRRASNESVKSLDDRNSSIIELVIQKISSLLHCKCLGASNDELKCIEENAQQLYSSFLSLNTKSKCKQNWCKTSALEKLPFYWAAISDNVIEECPFQNFKNFFIGDTSNEQNICKRAKYAKKIWDNLDEQSRLPFIIEALIVKISKGKVDLNDEYQIKCAIDALYSTN